MAKRQYPAARPDRLQKGESVGRFLQGSYLLLAGETECLCAITQNQPFYISKDEEKSYEDGRAPAADVQDELELKFPAVPKEDKRHGERGWFLSTIARLLEDKGLIEFRKDGSRSYYRSSKS